MVLVRCSMRLRQNFNVCILIGCGRMPRSCDWLIYTLFCTLRISAETTKVSKYTYDWR